MFLQIPGPGTHPKGSDSIGVGGAWSTVVFYKAPQVVPQAARVQKHLSDLLAQSTWRRG